MVIKMEAKGPKFNIIQYPNILYTLFINSVSDVKSIAKDTEIKNKESKILDVLYHSFNASMYEILKKHSSDPDQQYELLFDNDWVRDLNKTIMKDLKTMASYINKKEDDWFLWIDGINILNMNNFIDREEDYFKENIDIDKDPDDLEEDLDDEELDYIYQENLNLGGYDPDYFEDRIMDSAINMIDQFDCVKDMYTAKYKNKIVGFLSQLNICILSNKEPSCISLWTPTE